MINYIKAKFNSLKIVKQIKFNNLERKILLNKYSENLSDIKYSKTHNDFLGELDKDILKKYLEDNITENELDLHYENHYGSIFINTIIMLLDNEINDEQALKIINNNKYFKADISRVFMVKKSVYNINFYEKMLSFDLLKIKNVYVKDFNFVFNYLVSMEMKEELINFIFFDEEMSNKFYNVLKDKNNFELKSEVSEEMYNKILLRFNLTNRLEKKQTKEKVNKI